MDDGTAHDVAAGHEVLALFVSTLGGVHAIEQGDVVHLLSGFRQISGELHAGGAGGDGFGFAEDILFLAHDVECIEVAHAAGHHEEDDAFGGAWAIGDEVCAVGDGGAGEREERDAEGGFGETREELAPGEFVWLIRDHLGGR